MRFWFSRGSEVSIREQLVTQVVLGILSDDLKPGQRLPSTRDLARRFGIHPNTVSAGYRQLERERWVQFRKGSGVYVQASKPEPAQPAAHPLDALIVRLFASARKMGVPLPEVRHRLERWMAAQPPDHFLLVEPDEELRRILVFEIEQAVKLPVQSCDFETGVARAEGAIVIALANRISRVRELLPPASELLTLQIRSIPTSLQPWLPAPTGALVGIASRWEEFLKVARTFLTAAGIPPEGFVLRDGREPHWQRGLSETAAVVCDALTAQSLPAKCRPIVFSLLSETTIADLRKSEEFVSSAPPPL